MLTRLDLITYRAEHDRAITFDNLYTLLNYELLEMAFCKLQRDKAPGTDGVTVDQYEEHLQANLLDLETRLHRQSYRPHPSLRREIPKGNGKTRPLGMACVEDKIVQRRDDRRPSPRHGRRSATRLGSLHDPSKA